MHLPHDLRLRLADRELEPVSIGQSDAAVWRCTRRGHLDWYLKTASVADGGLEREAACVRWMRGVGLPVPAVIDYARESETDFLLSEAAIGTPASDSHWTRDANRVAITLGRGLARLHATDISTCPFDRSIARQLDEARDRITAGNVREDDFDEARLGRSATKLFAELMTMIPDESDRVFVHGDFCLPNVLLGEVDEELHITGLVDCGRCGIGDRHQDVALAIRSLTFNFNASVVDSFLSAYGDPSVRAKTLEFFTVLDEFF
ncbi:MAG TPA: APH(3') family aminoglycoside O-phosphotransferase [Gemmatimonadaceae bacterium]|jgi:aminoglycoside 3'-phosphotransferase-2